MLTEKLNFNLPESLIAQHPCEQRDQSRLMVVDRASGAIHLDIYYNLPHYLKRGDCLVMNDTRVIRARLHGRKASGGAVEVFLLHELEPGCWSALVRPSAKVKPGTRVFFSNGVNAWVGEVLDEGKRKVSFNHADIVEHLEQTGEIPLPPYIKRNTPSVEDAERYQTLYARYPGAVAAPTAGLHVSTSVLESLEDAGIQAAYLTLHVGYGTFKPVTTVHLEDHRVDAEEFVLPESTADILNKTRSAGGRIIAVGTTCARVLETRCSAGGFQAGAGSTSLYIYPPRTFAGVDLLQTNFHLPRSSLLALVCAFGGYELVMQAYERAISEKFRFYSYGDVMLIR
ncbi:MAG TPA: tRNA preQ1(34) S-adenosylmethionine ribosyltransferase-isomerase QueA [Candidatus Hydrogenedentes bacterium]|nr:tRNA preQ1(34) S-adenosylmethionine ribosyltransferase-isomerase QueA [Candidatus Hydrogenedentota bacterium]